MIQKIFIASLLLSFSLICTAAEKIELYAGEIKILKLSNVKRIAVGNPKVISNSMLNNGQLVLIAEGEGATNIHIWFSNGTEKDYTANVVAKTNNLAIRKIEIEQLLSHIDGLEIDMIGERIVLSGLVDLDNEEIIKEAVKVYDEIHVSINYAVATLVRKKLEVEDLLSDVEGLNVRIVGSQIVLDGLVDSGYQQAIETVSSKFEEVMDLTTRGSLDMSMPDNKMVLMNIKITEFNKNYLETIGIQWDTTIAGPAAGVAFSGASNSVFAASELPATSFNGLAPEIGRSALGYFGLVTEITSRINFGVNSGNAIILAEPRLAARSGGEATFLAGGEFPIQISNINGTTVEFKKFGIQLSVKPEVDRNNNVKAKVSTEISAINNAVAVDGIPGLNTRSTEADVILSSGETLVMSGLINQEASKDVQGIKWLKDLPILGRLFSSETFRDNKSELVIFVTPQVFDANSDINKKAKDYFNNKTRETIDAIDESSLEIVY
ncbi:MAG: pilus assembly protein CpaC [Gammaproteobacteria bacterium]|jgi:pilus assembly protein CpaC